MNDFLEIFLKEIPQILYEPIAVAGLLGILAAAVFYAKRPFGKFYWLIAGMLLYMLIWRIAIQIISSRYAEILLYPAVIASVYACFKFSDLIAPLFKKYIPEKIWRFLPYALVGGLCIACFCKAVRLSPYLFVKQVSNLVLQEQSENKGKRILILTEDDRGAQYRYYTKLPVTPGLRLGSPDQIPIDKKIYSYIARNRNRTDILIFVTREQSGTEPIQLKNNNRSDQRWKFLGQEYINRRKKKVVRVYRYTIR